MIETRFDYGKNKWSQNHKLHFLNISLLQIWPWESQRRVGAVKYLDWFDGLDAMKKTVIIPNVIILYFKMDCLAQEEKRRKSELDLKKSVFLKLF